MVTFIVIAVYALVILLDLIPQRKNWEKKEVVTYVALLVLGFAGLMAHSLHIKVPTINAGIASLVGALFPNFK